MARLSSLRSCKKIFDMHTALFKRQIMVGAESFRPYAVSAKVVPTLGHFGLIWKVISFFLALVTF